MRRMRHGVSQHEITGLVPHLRESILSSLRGLRSIPSINSSDQGSITVLSSQPLKTCVPTSILDDLLVTSKRVPQGVGLDISVTSIRTAFMLIDEIDIPTLSWLTETYVGSRAGSTEAILDVVEELCMAISEGFKQNPVSLRFLQRHIELGRYLPESIPRRFTLGPIVNALRAHLADLYRNGDLTGSAEVSSLLYICFILLIANNALVLQLLSEMLDLLQIASSTTNLLATQPSVALRPTSSPEPSIQESSGQNFTGFDAFCVSEGVSKGNLIPMGE